MAAVAAKDAISPTVKSRIDRNNCHHFANRRIQFHRFPQDRKAHRHALGWHHRIRRSRSIQQPPYPKGGLGGCAGFVERQPSAIAPAFLSGAFDKVDADFACCACYNGESAALALGQFNRRETPTQTPADALVQVATGEIWGRTPRGGLAPAVQAYTGKLKNARGIDFTTLIDPHRPDASPFEVRWYLNLTPGVQYRSKNGEDFACITAVVTNLQPYKI